MQKRFGLSDWIQGSFTSSETPDNLGSARVAVFITDMTDNIFPKVYGEIINRKLSYYHKCDRSVTDVNFWLVGWLARLWRDIGDVEQTEAVENSWTSVALTSQQADE